MFANRLRALARLLWIAGLALFVSRFAMAWQHLPAYVRFEAPELLGDWALKALGGAWPWRWAPHDPGWVATHVVALVLALLGWLGTADLGATPGMVRPAAVPIHGSARWRTQRELARTLLRVPMDAPNAAGVVVGSHGKHAWLTRPEVGNPHVLLIGATRSGKSRRVILPTIWAIGHAGDSLIATDPKGELYAHTARWLKERGYTVIRLDLHRPTAGHRWNPLAAIEAAKEAGDVEEAVRLAWELGHVLTSDSAGVSDPIWPQAEQSLIAALALAVVWEAPAGARHLLSAYRMLTTLGADGGEELDAWFHRLPPGHPARDAYGTAALSESRTRSSIYTGTAARLRLWSETGVAWLTAASDHDPADAGRRPTAIFLVLPDEAGARRLIAALYITQAYAALAALARDHGGKTPVPVWWLLDEAGNIGAVPGLPEKLTVGAGRGQRFLLAVQSLAQLQQLYGRDAETIVGNCDTWLYLRTADLDTARLISAKTGQYTVRTLARSRGRQGASESEGVTPRALLLPDEVLRWPLGRALLLQAGEHAAQLPLADLSAWPAASQNLTPEAPPTPAPVGAVEAWVPSPTVKGGGQRLSAGEILHGIRRGRVSPSA